MAQKRLVEIVLKGKDETKGAFDSLAESLGFANAGALKFAAAATAIATATAAAIVKVYEFSAEMAALGDDVEKLNQRTGVAIETLSEFRFALERGGGSAGDLEPAIRRLSRAMSDARDGIKEAEDAFSRLGLQTSDLVDGSGNLRSVEEVLPSIADGLRNLQSQADRMDVAQAIFGRGGTTLLPMLQQGAAGVREMRMEMEKYGGAMSQTFATKSAEFVDAQTNLANATQRLKEAMAEPFMDAFTGAVNSLAASLGTAIQNARQMQETNGGRNPWIFGANAETRQNLVNNAFPDRARYMQRDGLDSDFGAWLNGGGSPGALFPSLGPAAALGSAPRNTSLPDGMDWMAENGQNWWERYAIPDDIELFPVEGQGDFLRGMDEVQESMDSFSAAGQYAAASFQSAMSTAFAQAISDADNAAEAIVNVFKQTFAQLAGSFISSALFAAIGLPVNGPFGAVFAGKSMVSDGTKALPDPGTMTDYGMSVNFATAAAGKAYI